MKPSKIFLTSIFITTIIVVVVGSVANIVMAKNKSATVSPSSDTLQAYQQREAEYKQLIQQANQQIEQANTKLQAIQSQGIQAPQNASAAAPSVSISADKAEQIARQSVDPGQLLVKKPELVNFQGKAAYEVAFQKGSIYVDAQTGGVLFNGTVPQEITADKAVQIASDYLKNTDVLQVDQITFRNAPLYRVIFKDGMMVYMDLTGQITYILKSSSKIVVVTSPSSGSGAPASQPSAGGFHEDGGDNGND